MPESHRYCLTCGSDTTTGPDAKDPLVGKTLIGKYLILDTIGSGAMGTIYKAEQTSLGKTIVIKVLHRHLLNDPELIQRFQREARAASRLNHPNCVQIMDFGALEDGSLYIAMEYIHGVDLATLLERNFPIDHRRLINIMKQVCQGLDEAHANGVLHRDLKPENIMIEDRRTARDHVKVVDFGIAKLEENNPNSRRSFQTRTGIVCGTPEYMSPEQARGQQLDPRSDIYALGVMLYHLTTDRLPFEAPSPIEVVTKHISEPPVPPSTYRKDLPEAFERLILTMLEKDREKRPPSVMDVYTELERIDRELAAERREKITEKNADDATMVDMRPISQLVAAIDLGLRMNPQDDTTDQTERETIKRAAGNGSSAAAALSDTIPEPQGRVLAERMAALMPTGTQIPVRPTRPPNNPTPVRSKVAAGIEPAVPPKARPKNGSTANGKPASEVRRPDTSLVRENITVESKSAPASAVLAPPVRANRQLVWWVAGGVLIAGAITAAILAF